MQTRDAFHITGFQSLSLKNMLWTFEQNGWVTPNNSNPNSGFFLTDVAVYETSRSVIVKKHYTMNLVYCWFPSPRWIEIPLSNIINIWYVKLITTVFYAHQME